MLRLFRARSVDELERYVRDVHWNPKNVKYDVFSLD